MYRCLLQSESDKWSNRNSRKERDGIKILYINVEKHEKAVEEVSKLHQTDEIIIIGETPLVDGQPVDIEGYATVTEVYGNR